MSLEIFASVTVVDKSPSLVKFGYSLPVSIGKLAKSVYNKFWGKKEEEPSIFDKIRNKISMRDVGVFTIGFLSTVTAICVGSKLRQKH